MTLPVRQLKPNVRNMIFFSVTPLISVIGGGAYLWFHGITWVAVALFFAMLILTLMSISAGYHRLFSHRTHEAAGWLKFCYLAFGAATFEESVLRWASDHRLHHRFVDTDKDPYNIKRGALWAHIGWILYDEPEKRPLAKDLEEDPWVAWQDRYWIPLAGIFGFGLPTAVGALFGDPWGGLLFGGVIRTVVGHHFTFSINSLAHMIGTQPYSDSNTARDSWITAIFTFGEGYHNFHHWQSGDYRNGVRAFHWDPPKWFIRAMSWFGQTWGLKTTPEEAILRARIQMERQRIRQAPASMAQTVEAQFEKLMGEVEEWSRRRRAWTDAMYNASTLRFESEATHLRERCKEIRRQCRQSYKTWRLLLRQAQGSPAI